jgi:hypothetical protein
MRERFVLTTLFFSILLVLPLLSPSARATTVAPPDNLGQLARISQAVVYAEAVESWFEEGDSLPMTVTRFHLVEQVTGANPGTTFEVREPGGRGREKSAAVAGAPRFDAGSRYLLFLDRAPGGRWRSKTLAYGLLREVEGTGVLRPLPQAGELEILPGKSAERVGSYRKGPLLQHLREVARGARWDPQTAGASLESAGGEKTHAAPDECDFLTDMGDGLPIRWFGFETGATTVTINATTPGQTGISDGGVAAIQQGLAAWTNHPDTVIRFNYGGTQPRSFTCSGNFDYQSGAAIFDDPCEDLADLSNCVGTLAFGGAIYNNNTTQTYGGEPWHPAFSTFVVVNDGAQCIGEINFKETLTHELGHAMGFGHHEPANPASATMSAFLKKDGRGASISATDKACAAYAYHTFFDVPPTHGFWRFIEAIENAGVTGGCGGGNYCPGNTVTREQMAVFLLVAKEGKSYTPPACTTPRFTDVPCSSPFAPWINELVARGVVAGCGSGKFCPDNPVTRGQMAVLLLATLEGTGYAPPACTTARFLDVPCSSPLAPWINELVERGITAGCGASQYCPATAVTRGPMSVFLTGTFSLPAPPAP